MGLIHFSDFLTFHKRLHRRKDSLRLTYPIPRLRFVRGRHSYSEKPLNGAPAGGASSGFHRAAYMLEELLPMNLEFIKYIHNAEAVIPLQDDDEPGYDIGLFLCFI